MTGTGGQPDTLPAIDLVVQSPLWNHVPQAESTIRGAILAASTHLSTAGGEIAIVLTDDSAIQALNRDWRGIDKPTNVLSFPSANTGASGVPRMLGDIVMAYETLARESTEEGKDILHHLAHLAVHGYLHLLGYDHEEDAKADEMERLESRILASLNVPDPYADDERVIRK